MGQQDQATAGQALMANRVVTGDGPDGKSMVVSHGAPACITVQNGYEVAELWGLDGALRSSAEGGDPAEEPWTMIPNPGGLAWRLTRITASAPAMHQTDTLDLLLITEGEIELILETGVVHMRTGDTAVVRDSAHGWRLIDEKPCTMVAVMLRPDPPGNPAVRAPGS
jgi:hypothetical protein